MDDEILISSDSSVITADNERGTIAPPSTTPNTRRFRGYTIDDLIARILTRYGEIGFGQSQEPEAHKRVRDALPGILEELALDEIYAFPLDADVPGAAMDPLSAIVASRLADDFGLSAEEAALLGQREQGAVARLRRYRAAPAFNGQPTRPDFF